MCSTTIPYLFCFWGFFSEEGEDDSHSWTMAVICGFLIIIVLIIAAIVAMIYWHRKSRGKEICSGHLYYTLYALYLTCRKPTDTLNKFYLLSGLTHTGTSAQVGLLFSDYILHMFKTDLYWSLLCLNNAKTVLNILYPVSVDISWNAGSFLKLLEWSFLFLNMNIWSIRSISFQQLCRCVKWFENCWKEIGTV